MGVIGQSELHNYFCAVGELRQAVGDAVDPEDVRFLLEEIQGIALNTDSTTLRERCLEVLRQHAPELAAQMA